MNTYMTPLHPLLARQRADQIVLKVDEIGRLVERHLCPSAYTHPAFWADRSRPHAVWRRAGFRAALRPRDGTVVFTRL